MKNTVIKITPEGQKGSSLHTLEEAFAKIQLLAQEGKIKDAVTVSCAGGIYKVNNTIRISGKLPCPVTVESAPGEQAIFDGGYTLRDWKKTRLNGKEVFVCPVPAQAAPDGFLRALFVNGIRAQRAAFPKGLEQGYEIEKGGTVIENEPGSGYDYFYPRKEDFNPDWYNLPGMEVLLIQKWTENYMPFKKYAKDGALHFHCTTALRCYGWDKTLYFFCNVREALTEEGEYYFDNTQSLLYYRPRKGEKLSTLEAVLPMADMMFFISNTQNVTLKDLLIRHGGRSFPTIGTRYDLEGIELVNGFTSPARRAVNKKHPAKQAVQGAVQLPGTVTFSHAKDCRMENCIVERSSWYGALVNGGCSGITFQSNTFRNLGGGGIIACGTNAAAYPELHKETVTHLQISDNYIHHCGEIYFSATGILLGFVCGSLVEHNHIHDLYYSGISCGYTWGYNPTSCCENRILFNKIHDIGKKVLCDMGGIYMLGVQPGSRICHNLIYNIECRYYGGWALYTDEGSSHMILENNVTYDCACEGYHHHYGRENILRGNLFIGHKHNGVCLSVGQSNKTNYTYPGENYTANCNFFKNVIVTEGNSAIYITKKEIFAPGHLCWEDNLYWDVSGKKLKNFADLARWETDHKQLTFSQWQKQTAYDQHALYADPGFVDLEKRDLHLKEDSILRKKSFPDPAITLDQAGVRKKK